MTFGLETGKVQNLLHEFKNRLNDNFKRIATVMFYLSDLVGGFTAFPAMGVALKPSEGSAVLWFNTDLGAGNRDLRYSKFNHQRF